MNFLEECDSFYEDFNPSSAHEVLKWMQIRSKDDKIWLSVLNVLQEVKIRSVPPSNQSKKEKPFEKSFLQ